MMMMLDCFHEKKLWSWIRTRLSRDLGECASSSSSSKETCSTWVVIAFWEFPRSLLDKNETLQNQKKTCSCESRQLEVLVKSHTVGQKMTSARLTKIFVGSRFGCSATTISNRHWLPRTTVDYHMITSFRNPLHRFVPYCTMVELALIVEAICGQRFLTSLEEHSSKNLFNYLLWTSKWDSGDVLESFWMTQRGKRTHKPLNRPKSRLILL